ncbi:hypothetical protein NQZ68_033037 [Dissostichus eleginoides]|nr:hypothetical protein NQZ68_033037 [Dissostichus eleginoides]
MQKITAQKQPTAALTVRFVPLSKDNSLCEAKDPQASDLGNGLHTSVCLCCDAGIKEIACVVEHFVGDLCSRFKALSALQLSVLLYVSPSHSSSCLNADIFSLSSATIPHDNCARVLLVRGADKDVKNYNSQSPFQGETPAAFRSASLTLNLLLSCRGVFSGRRYDGQSHGVLTASPVERLIIGALDEGTEPGHITVFNARPTCSSVRMQIYFC